MEQVYDDDDDELRLQCDIIVDDVCYGEDDEIEYVVILIEHILDMQHDDHEIDNLLDDVDDDDDELLLQQMQQHQQHIEADDDDDIDEEVMHELLDVNELLWLDIQLIEVIDLLMPHDEQKHQLL